MVSGLICSYMIFRSLQHLLKGNAGELRFASSNSDFAWNLFRLL
jgi:hypothetical protein